MMTIVLEGTREKPSDFQLKEGEYFDFIHNGERSIGLIVKVVDEDPLVKYHVQLDDNDGSVN